MAFTAIDILSLLGIGAAAGFLGGLVGIGGSIIMIPAMYLLFANRPWHDQHLFQAAAMAVNVFVALPATLRHRRAGAIRADLVKPMLPFCLVAIIAGVLLSNLLDSDRLAMVFALFLFYAGATTLLKVIRKKPDHPRSPDAIPPAKAGAVGGIMGLAAGLLGIGGGGVAVPLAHALCKVPFKEAIAASAAVMSMTAALGATIKLATLSHAADAQAATWPTALTLAALLAPTAILGAYLGAGATHRAPVALIRTVFGITILIAAARMSGLL